MGNVIPLIHTATAIAAVVFLILKAKVNPALALVLGAIYLGIVCDLGAERTLELVNQGFGDLLAKVGLLIVLGVLLGTLLSALGALEKLMALLLRSLGPRFLPYSFAVLLGTGLQFIFTDVLLVMTAPLARSLGVRIGPGGAARIAVAMAVGLEVGVTLSVPGVGTLALAGLLGVPLGVMLLYGFPLAIVTITLTLLLFSALIKRGFWKPEHDESPAALEETAPSAQALTNPAQARGSLCPPPLALSLSPLLLAMAMIATGAFSAVAEWRSPLVGFLSDPVAGLLAGVILACLIARRHLPKGTVGDAFGQGYRLSGQFLVLRGVGGSLAAVMGAVGLGGIVEGTVASSTWAPLLLVWLIAAALHLAIGSVITSAITAAGILAPVAPSLDVQPVLVALAAGAGSLFAIHATSNTFWMLQALLGQTTRGALKTVTMSVSAASVIALGLIQAVSLMA
ncbi:GntP family permease [Streptomyces smyrnaeus]|uniref:GntP family permease n=1 Tax=Streptomyces TaxID=1883 RepID=UPI000C1822DE|nr:MULTISPECIES: gluconate permease [unclassified Streptomyces]MBQ0862698.1 gluconate permease [Streptomyces sp. RK75]MBQ1119293.1 gluconate permease [Streptomyces sp. B15]MBQ1159921.1 gluconate permease [Streptomyces sp. A73]